MADRKSGAEKQEPFFKAQEAQAALDEVDEEDEEDEAEWDRLFNDPAKVGNFARWADKSRACSVPKPIEPSRL